MNNSKTSKFNGLNFNLINEIFSYFPLTDLVNNVFPVSKNFMNAFCNFKDFKLIKANFENFLSEATYDYSKMEILKDSFKIEGLSEASAYNTCIYLSLRKIKNHKKLTISVTDFIKKHENSNFFKKIISLNKSIKALNLCFYDIEGVDIQDIICFIKDIKNSSKIKKLNYQFKSEFNWEYKICLELINSNLIQNLKLKIIKKYDSYPFFYVVSFLDDYYSPGNAIEILFEALSMNNSIKKLKLKVENLDFFNSKHIFYLLGKVFDKNKSINYLNLSNYGIDYQYELIKNYLKY